MAGVASRYGLLDDLKGSNRSRRPETFVHELDEPSTVAFRQPTKEEADWYAVGRNGHCVAVVEKDSVESYDDYYGPQYEGDYDYHYDYRDYDYGRGECDDQRVADYYDNESYYSDRSWLADIESSHAWEHAKSGLGICSDDSCPLNMSYDSYGFASEVYDNDESLSTWAEIALDRERLDIQSPRRQFLMSFTNPVPEAPTSRHEAARQAARSKRTERQWRERRMVHGRLRLRQDHATGAYYMPRWMYLGLRDTWSDQNRLRGPRRQESEAIRFERELDLEPTLPMGKVKPKPESETEEAPPKEEPKVDLSHFVDPWGDEVFDEPLGNQTVRSMGIYVITFDGDCPDWDTDWPGLTGDDTWGIPPEDAVLLREELDDPDLLDRPEWPLAVTGSTARPYLDAAHRVGRR
jgi:hypothetical protein